LTKIWQETNTGRKLERKTGKKILARKRIKKCEE
jgi:hypothetical protein